MNPDHSAAPNKPLVESESKAATHAAGSQDALRARQSGHLILLAITFAGICAATTVWALLDRYIDREESGHVIRVFQTLDAINESDGLINGARRLFTIRTTEDSKPWYGWPYYLLVALLWKLFFPSYDMSLILNTCFLGIAAIGVWLITLKLSTGRQAAATAATLFFFLLPGTLVWCHVFSPTMFLVAATSGVTAGLVTQIASDQLASV